LTPKIVTCHDIIGRLPSTDTLHRLHAKFTLSGLESADFIIADSESTKKEIIKFYSISEERIKVIYQGVDHEHFYPREVTSNLYHRFNLSPSYKYILHLSIELPRKNVAGIIQAFAKLKKEFSLGDIKLIKAGVPQHQRDRESNLNLIKKLRLDDSVIFLDHIPEKDLPFLYNVADLFVFPSFYEGFGFPPLEAMACGTPVITSNTSSLPEVVGDAGIMVNPHDVDKLAEEMLKVLTKEGLRQDMINRGLERAKLFTWEKTAQETMSVYEEVLSTL
jgi:glycosyltransferase involved in cell wall biosynthesis